MACRGAEGQGSRTGKPVSAHEGQAQVGGQHHPFFFLGKAGREDQFAQARLAGVEGVLLRDLVPNYVRASKTMMMRQPEKACSELLGRHRVQDPQGGGRDLRGRTDGSEFQGVSDY